MLISFSVANFMSIYEMQTLDMVATPLKGLEGILIDNKIKIPDYKQTKLIKSAVIYGANASGKSNICFALRTMKEIIVDSTDEDYILPYKPYKLIAEAHNQPSEFEIMFIADDNIVYQYGFSYLNNQIISEFLCHYGKNNRQNIIFHRYYQDDNYIYDNANAIKKELGKKSFEKLIKRTKDSNLFLTMCLNEELDLLKSMNHWLRKKLSFMSSEFINAQPTSKWLKENPQNKEKLMKFIKQADLYIQDINFSEKELTDEEKAGLSKVIQDFPDDIKAEFDIEKVKKTEIQTSHINDKGDAVNFDLDDESLGTKKYIALAEPIFRIIDEGMVLIADEFNTNLHPDLTNFIIQKIHHESQSGQLIMTTHDASLLRKRDYLGKFQPIFRRDQVVLINRKNLGSSHISKLSDYNLRESDDLMKLYCEGRVRGVPIIHHNG